MQREKRRHATGKVARRKAAARRIDYCMENVGYQHVRMRGVLCGVDGVRGDRIPSRRELRLDATGFGPLAGTPVLSSAATPRTRCPLDKAKKPPSEWTEFGNVLNGPSRRHLLTGIHTPERRLLKATYG